MVTATSAPTYLHNAQSQRGAARQGLSSDKSEPAGNAASGRNATRNVSRPFSAFLTSRSPARKKNELQIILKTISPQKIPVKGCFMLQLFGKSWRNLLAKMLRFMFSLLILASCRRLTFNNKLNQAKEPFEFCLKQYGEVVSQFWTVQKSIQMIVDQAVAWTDEQVQQVLYTKQWSGWMGLRSWRRSQFFYLWHLADFGVHW